MIEQKILDKNTNYEKLKNKNYIAYWLKSFNRGNHFFITNKTGEKILFLNSDQKFSKNTGAFSITENINNNGIFTVGFEENNNIVKIITYKGNGTVQEIYHNSQKDPSVLIIKKTTNRGNWLFWTENFGYRKFLHLNKTHGLFEDENIFLSSPPNQYYFRISSCYNEENEDYIAILFFGNKNFSSGIYSGGVKEVKTGIQNDLVIVKNISSHSNWRVFSKIFSNPGDSFKLNNCPILLNSKKIINNLYNDYFIPQGNCNSINKEKNTYVYMSFGENNQ